MQLCTTVFEFEVGTDYKLFSIYQYTLFFSDLVIKSLMNKTESTESCGVKLKLEALTPTVKEAAITFKKAMAGEE